MTGAREFEHRFKAAVEKNFDLSADAYDRFEERHHLFETLTRRQLELIEPSVPMRMLDVGCGTGISTLALHQALAGHSPTIYALDISERMLLRARERCRNVPGVYFIRGDAENLSAYFNESFDAIFYTASIFLLPGFAESLRQASGLLVPGGVLSISFYAGLFDGKGDDAIRKAFPDQRYMYGAVPVGELVSCLEALPGSRTLRVDYRFEVSRDFLFDFLSIPAQSAGLFPKIPYLERIPNVRALCDLLVKRVDPVYMGWEFLIVRKR
ncbi:MAG TPA: class I SAM-dependent methyltransferase [Candidatus Methylomirabilis sp.]|nr:class I SAM-dependent methyltransferase [Candidatus Methylomirabilis sp.]